MTVVSEDRSIFWRRNITLNYIVSSLMWGRFFLPVLALFYIASQVSLEQFTIIMAVFALSTLLFEIPTGVVADFLGKKNTLLISRFMYIIEIALVAFGNGFWVFLIAKIISGIGVSLSSGTSDALLYDSLKRLRRQSEYKKIAGISSAISKISMAVVLIIGAYLFTIHYKLPALASLPLIILGFLLTFFFTEPYIPKKNFTLKNSLAHLGEGLRSFKNNYYLKYIAAFTFLAGSVIGMMYSFSSAYFHEIIIPLSLIGFAAFIGSLFSAYAAHKAHRVEVRLGEKKSLFWVLFLIIASVLLMSFIVPYYGLLFYLIIPFIDGFYGVIIGDYVNSHVTSSHRVTMLSINNMFDNIGVFLLFPIFGFVNKSYSMSTAFLSLGIFIFIAGILMLFFYKNQSSNIVMLKKNN